MVKKRSSIEYLYLIKPMIREGVVMGGSYVITKYKHEGVEAETYTVSIENPKTGPLVPYCSCMGFRMQKYPKIRHKHVKMALDYQAQGEPREGIYYRIGKDNFIIFDHIAGEN